MLLYKLNISGKLEFMSENEEVRVVHENTAVSNGTRPKEVDRTVSGRSFVSQIIYLITSVLLSLLAIRFILLLLGARTANGFVSFIYNITNPFVRPFYGIFGKSFVYGNGQGKIEYETIIAAIIYLIISALILKVVSLGKRNVQP